MLWYLARRRRYLWDHTAAGATRFHSVVTGRGLFLIYAGNLLLLLLTLGLAWPWAKTRSVRYTFRCLSLDGPLDLETIQQDARAASSTGEGLAGMLDSGSGFDFGCQEVKRAHLLRCRPRPHAPLGELKPKAEASDSVVCERTRATPWRPGMGAASHLNPLTILLIVSGLGGGEERLGGHVPGRPEPGSGLPGADEVAARWCFQITIEGEGSAWWPFTELRALTQGRYQGEEVPQSQSVAVAWPSPAMVSSASRSLPTARAARPPHRSRSITSNPGSASPPATTT